jgi:hypothetical protein
MGLGPRRYLPHPAHERIIVPVMRAEDTALAGHAAHDRRVIADALRHDAPFGIVEREKMAAGSASIHNTAAYDEREMASVMFCTYFRKKFHVGRGRTG